jgi:hypothetical protein
MDKTVIAKQVADLIEFIDDLKCQSAGDPPEELDEILHKVQSLAQEIDQSEDPKQCECFDTPSGKCSLM